MQSIKAYNAPPGNGPNPWKVILVLAELELPYEVVWIPYGDIKNEPYVSLNPNGRLPAMIDPNTDVTLWESGAIINYLIDRYDRDHKLTYGGDDAASLQDRYQAQSWLMFQMSGHGPTFGQKMWFTHFHVEHGLTTAIMRYANEARRILGVVDASLRKQRRSLGLEGTDDPVYLVGDKCTFADLAFVPWDVILLSGGLFPDGGLDVEREFPEFYRWHRNVTARPVVRKIIEYREECMRTMEDTATEVRRRQEDGRKTG